MTVQLPWLFLVPMAGGVLCFITGRRTGRIVGITAAMITTALCLLCAMELREFRVQRYWVGGWEIPLGISLYADGLSMTMILMRAVTSLMISLYAMSYFTPSHGRHSGRESESFWPLWLLLWSTLNGLYLAADIFNIYVLLELIGIGAVALVTITGTRVVLVAGMRYLLANIMGSLSYLMGVAMLYATYDTLDLYTIGELIEPGRAGSMAFALMTLGLMVKTAVFPLHFWLPPAHSNAASPVSALLSALVVKGSFYVMLRFWFELYQNIITVNVGQLMGILGSMAIIWGSVQALRQKRLKLLVAHSTVAQLGYLMLIFPITVAVTPVIGAGIETWVVEAGKGGVYHACSHMLAKASIFLASGVIIHAVGNDQLVSMRGLAERLPITTFALAMSGLSLMGLPPSGGFIGKWLLLHAALGSGQWWWTPIIMTGGLLTAAYIFLMLRYAFRPSDASIPHRHVSIWMEMPAFILAAIAVLIGLMAYDLMDILSVGTPFSIELIGGGGSS